MCAITGFLQGGTGDEGQWRAVLEAMAATVRHRGPDAGGVWADIGAGVGLAHRRLAILDLSPAGAQPMQSASGRYCLVFNGEIYNFRELAAELSAAGARFRGHSDTEVILAAVDAWGLERSLQRLTGMFAFALWDKQERRLHLARDRIGEKPLYYGVCGRTLLFGSELKALRAHPAWSGEICRQSLTLLLRYGYIPEPYSIYQGIHKLPPGTSLSLDAAALADPARLAPGGEAGPRSYWSLRAAAEAGLAEPWSGSPSDAVDALEQRLQTIIGQQMVADVPLGAFLSGGIDSSTVVALMQAQSTRPVQTFTIGFGERTFNEAEHAKAVARHLGTDHTELYVSAQDALDVIPRLPQLYDEPFADPSQIPTFLVSQLARRRVTVALSGDGGDELFAGYNRYLWTQKVWQRRQASSRMSRSLAAGALSALPAPRLNRLFEVLARLLPVSALRQPNLGGKLHKLAAALRAGNKTELYRMLVSYWQTPGAVVPGAAEPLGNIRADNVLAGARALIDDLMYWDLTSYLPGDNLVKVDRASMGVGLEVRVPLLDHRLVEFAWRIPADLKLRDGQSKWLLRQVAYRHIPRELLERPKMGFSVPVSSWLRGTLREWGEDLLAPERLARQGLVSPEVVQQSWQAHQAGREDGGLALWTMLMFQAWYDEQQQRTSPALAKTATADERHTVFSPGAAAIPSG
jgi:asparagine synthase (glutamine-hydrolysing)